MQVKTILLVTFLSFLGVKGMGQSYPYWNSELTIQERLDDLMSRMTLDEKIGQLTKLPGWKMYEKGEHGHLSVSTEFKDRLKQGDVGSLWATLRADPWTQKSLSTGLQPAEAAKVTNLLQQYARDSTRLGIPLLLAEEAPHGHMAIGATVFPTAIGQASTWNPALIREMAKAIAVETAAVGGRNTYGPVLDLAREPRWSRTEETYGEDRYLVGQMGAAMVEGVQGTDEESDLKMISTLKHFVAYGASEGGHNGGSVSVGERTLRQHYLYPFASAVKAGAGSVMTAYNSIDGIPCTSNPWLLKTVLREEWGFRGFVVSDLLSISGLMGSHQISSSAPRAAAQGLSAGVDVDLSGEGYGAHLLKALEEGLVEESQIDTAVRRVLQVKFNLGLFENPYVEETLAGDVVGNAAHRTLAKQIARESLTLLKNDKGLLPLSKSIKRIAVIGPNGDNVYNQLGDYTAPQAERKVTTVLQGIRNKLGNEVQVDYVKGCAIRDRAVDEIQQAVRAAERAEVVVLVLGGSSARDFRTSYDDTGAAKQSDELQGLSDMESGEGFDRATLELMGNQLELMKAVAAVGKPTVLVLIKGRPLLLNRASESVAAIVDAWYPGEQGGDAIADVLFGDYNPAGRLPISVPRSVGQLPVYYNHDKPKRHHYIDLADGPLYPFGYGLSYSTFVYSNLQMTSSAVADSVELHVQFQVRNNGPFDGEEVVQLYLRDTESSVVTPVKQLVGFQRVALKNDEEKTIEFRLTEEDLSLWNRDGRWVVEPGSFQLEIGSSSEDVRLQGTFNVPEL